MEAATNFLPKLVHFVETAQKFQWQYSQLGFLYSAQAVKSHLDQTFGHILSSSGQNFCPNCLQPSPVREFADRTKSDLSKMAATRLNLFLVLLATSGLVNVAAKMNSKKD